MCPLRFAPEGHSRRRRGSTMTEQREAGSAILKKAHGTGEESSYHAVPGVRHGSSGCGPPDDGVGAAVSNSRGSAACCGQRWFGKCSGSGPPPGRLCPGAPGRRARDRRGLLLPEDLLPGTREERTSLREGLRKSGTSTFVVLALIVALDNLQSSGLARWPRTSKRPSK